MKAALTQAAWAASRTKHTYFGSKYKKLAARRGKKRAIVALGHKLLVVAYHVLKEKKSYKELGEDYLEQRNKEQVVRHHRKVLEKLGFQVTEKKAA